MSSEPGRVALRIGATCCTARETSPALAAQVFRRRLIETEISLDASGSGAALSLDAYLSRLKGLGYEHAALKVGGSSPELLDGAARELGQPIVEMVTYTLRAPLGTYRPLKPLCAVRPLQEADVPELLAIARTAFRFTRFYRDPFFPQADCDRFYEELARSYCLDARSSAVVVAQRRGRVVGFLACRLRQGGGKDGALRVRNQGLGAATPGNPGCYPTLVGRALELWSPATDLAEFDGQADNAGAIRVWEHFRMERTGGRAIFHVPLC